MTIISNTSDYSNGGPEFILKKKEDLSSKRKTIGEILELKRKIFTYL